MSNLLQETAADILHSGHKTDDIVFIGSESSGHQCTWSEFEELANFDYDEGFGSQKIATDLIIVFSDGMIMRRSEYDGSEDWEYSTPFVAPKTKLPIKTLGGDQFMWNSLATMQEESDDE